MYFIAVLAAIPFTMSSAQAVEYPFSTDMRVTIEKGKEPVYSSSSNIVYPVLSYFEGNLLDGDQFSLQHTGGVEITYSEEPTGRYLINHVVTPMDDVNYAPDTMTAVRPVRVLLQGPIDLGHINFRPGSAVLSADAKVALNEMAMQMMASELTAAYMVGTTDRSGSESANLVLSRKRVDAAAAYLEKQLINLGVMNPAITTENMGEYLSTTRDGVSNLDDRKVTVLIYPNFS
jgi:outer membrane protein OmpA-like peptidoglycan-associated protein